MALSDRLREMKNNQMLTTLGQQQGIVPPQPASLGNIGGGQGVVQDTETAMPMPIQTEKKTIQINLYKMSAKIDYDKTRKKLANTYSELKN